MNIKKQTYLIISFQSMRGRAAHHTSHKLVGANMVAIYVTCAIFSVMLGEWIVLFFLNYTREGFFC